MPLQKEGDKPYTREPWVKVHPAGQAFFDVPVIVSYSARAYQYIVFPILRKSICCVKRLVIVVFSEYTELRRSIPNSFQQIMAGQCSGDGLRYRHDYAKQTKE